MYVNVCSNSIALYTTKYIKEYIVVDFIVNNSPLNNFFYTIKMSQLKSQVFQHPLLTRKKDSRRSQTLRQPRVLQTAILL